MIETVVGGVLVLFVAAVGGVELYRRIGHHLWIRRRLAAWTALAEPFGFRVEARKRGVTILGTVASRPFELDCENIITYGLDGLLGMRVDLQGAQATFAISADELPDGLGSREFYELYGALEFFETFGDVQPPVGDAAFDAVYKVRANAAGRRLLESLGPEERRTLLAFPGMGIYWRPREPWVDFGDRELQAAQLSAVLALMARLIAVSEAVPAPRE
jgi:hypothetical protein